MHDERLSVNELRALFKSFVQEPGPARADPATSIPKHIKVELARRLQSVNSRPESGWFDGSSVASALGNIAGLERSSHCIASL